MANRLRSRGAARRGWCNCRASIAGTRRLRCFFDSLAAPFDPVPYSLKRSESSAAADVLPACQDFLRKSPEPGQYGVAAGGGLDLATDEIEGLFDFGVEILAEGEWIGRENEQGKNRAVADQFAGIRARRGLPLVANGRQEFRPLVTPDLRDLIPVSFNSLPLIHSSPIVACRMGEPIFNQFVVRCFEIIVCGVVGQPREILRLKHGFLSAAKIR